MANPNSSSKGPASRKRVPAHNVTSCSSSLTLSTPDKLSNETSISLVATRGVNECPAPTTRIDKLLLAHVFTRVISSVKLLGLTKFLGFATTDEDQFFQVTCFSFIESIFHHLYRSSLCLRPDYF